MIRSDKKLRELDLILSRNNILIVSEAIKSLRNEVPFEGAIGLLIAYYDRSANLSLKNQIRDFMNDLKEQSAIPEVIAEIKKDNKPETLRMLISSCWQSGLDYSGYSSDFARFFLDGDFMTAIECFTVIESSVHKIKRSKKNEIIKMIREESPGQINEKTALALELISVLE